MGALHSKKNANLHFRASHCKREINTAILHSDVLSLVSLFIQVVGLFLSSLLWLAVVQKL